MRLSMESIKEQFDDIFPKLNIVQDKKYRLWIATLPCLVSNSNCDGQIIPHHIKRRSECSDYETVPLCSIGHHQGDNTSIHHTNMGKERFQAKHGIDLKEEADKLYKEYQEEHGLFQGEREGTEP